MISFMAVSLRRRHEKTPFLVVTCLTALLGACAAPPAHYTTPDHWSKDGYEWPPGSGAELALPPSSTYAQPVSPLAAPEPSGSVSLGTASAGVFVPRMPTPEPTAAPLHSDSACLSTLRRLGVSFTRLPDLKGVENPVEIHGSLAGITFWSSDRRPLQLDCRLAIALENLRPVFRAHGVTRARFSGAYSYRTTRTGRLSHHALGLAIDIHEVSLGGKTLSVDVDFSQNVGCRADIPLLNRLACSLRETRQFEEFLTPDFNADHRDHLHISVPKRRSDARRAPS